MFGEPIDGSWNVTFSYANDQGISSTKGNMYLVGSNIEGASDDSGATYTGSFTLDENAVTLEVVASMGDGGNESPLPGLTYPLNYSLTGFYQGELEPTVFWVTGEINGQFKVEWMCKRAR